MNTDHLVAHGHCPACGQDTTFRSKEHWLSDHFLCDNCGSIPRERALMRVIEMYYPNWRDLRIHESSPGNRGTSVTLRRECKNYTASQYDTKIAFGKKHRSGSYQSEDLENQTFEDEAFDLVITQDVMEHVFDPDAAFREISRTLRPGGAHIFTTPLVNKGDQTQRCAILHEDGVVEHLREPEYHGNPIDSSGSLVTFRWGYDITRRVMDACGLMTTMICIDDLSMGIRAEYIEVCVTHKPALIGECTKEKEPTQDKAPERINFDLHRPGVTPGNLHAGSCRWSEPHERSAIGTIPESLDEHPRRDELLEAFDAQAYLKMNSDLARAGITVETAREHFLEYGYRQRRVFSKHLYDTLDAKFYRQRYPQLELSNRHDANVHYAYVGRYEDKIPNKITDEHMNARVHLFQMGKVGSISIRDAIKQAGGGESVHVHWADHYHKTMPTLGVHYSRVLNHHRSKPAAVVVGVRDPFERVISGFFQEAESNGIEKQLADDQGVVAEIQSRLKRDAWVICNWFDHQFYSGLDIYDKPFDHQAGFVVMENQSLRVFVYRLDALDRLEQPLASFLGLSKLKMLQKNTSKGKGYASQYQRVAQQFQVPDQVANSLAESVYTKHFFTDQEREQMLKRWSSSHEDICML